MILNEVGKKYMPAALTSFTVSQEPVYKSHSLTKFTTLLVISYCTVTLPKGFSEYYLQLEGAVTRSEHAVESFFASVHKK